MNFCLIYLKGLVFVNTVSLCTSSQPSEGNLMPLCKEMMRNAFNMLAMISSAISLKAISLTTVFHCVQACIKCIGFI